MTLIKNMWSLFSEREQWQSGLLLLGMLVQAASQLVGVASLGPFMSIVADPSVVERNEWLSTAYEFFGFTSTRDFLVACGFTVIAVLAVSNAVSVVVLWATNRFLAGAQHRLSVRLVRGYIGQPYAFFVERNTAQLHTNVLSEVGTVIRGVLRPVLALLAQSLVTCAIIAFLFYLDPVLATAAVVILGGAYALIYTLVRVRQRRIGRERVDANKERYKVSGEVFGGIKDVKVLQREGAFLKQFKPASYRFSSTVASNATIAAAPRYLLETIAFGGILLIILYYLSQGQGMATVLPVLSMYAFAGYRLMPSLQQLFGSLATVRFNGAALDDVLEDLRLTQAHAEKIAADAPEPKPLPFHRTIRFDRVTYRYPGASEDALKRLSLEIRHFETVGLVGPSGSGKTTLVDLLLGLYEPESGDILVDEAALRPAHLASWRRQIGYIPQSIFLTDDTIARNIALGVPADEIDADRVREAARIAHLHDFVETLSQAYETVVGERGVRLSGGQRQRIGIARALYHNPEVLIMDEATSALDGVTEDAVMDAIRDLAGQKTIILIAHRISTVRDCDQIFMLENGRVAEQGTYDELTSRSADFRAMAKLEPA